ncbi:MAG TPA: DUF4440 domain-containing protein [Caulobacter sp.]|nr:DUF4440 domain-containing protein [Caulobacter sp.]
MSGSNLGRRGALGLLGVGLLAGPAVGRPAAGDPAAAVADFHGALARGDGEAAAALLAEEAVIFEEGHVERSRAEYVAGHLPADMKFSAAVPATVTSRKTTLAGDMALVLTEGAMRGAYNGKAVDRISIETVVLRRGPGGWRIVHIHWSGRPA